MAVIARSGLGLRPWLPSRSPRGPRRASGGALPRAFTALGCIAADRGFTSGTPGPDGLMRTRSELTPMGGAVLR